MIATAILNGKGYQLVGGGPDSWEIQRYNDIIDEFETIATADVEALAWQTWAAVLIADRAGRL